MSDAETRAKIADIKQRLASGALKYEVAAAYGIPNSSFREWLGRLKANPDLDYLPGNRLRDWNADDMAVLRRCAAAGMSAAETGAQLDPPRGAREVQRRTTRAGVKLRDDRPYWSDAENATFRRMIADGATARDIADALGRTRDQVHSKARKSGLTICKDVVAIANSARRNLDVLRRRGIACQGRPAIPITDEMVAEIRRMAALGMSGPQVALQMGQPYKRVSAWAERFGVSFRRLQTVQPARKDPPKKRHNDGARLAPRLDIVRAEPGAAAKDDTDARYVPAPLRVKHESPSPWRSCQWIDGEPHADACKCGKATVPGWSYCVEHHQRSYRLYSGSGQKSAAVAYEAKRGRLAVDRAGGYL